MKRIILFGFVAGISALAVSSCAYDPYYSGGYGGSNRGGYGDGYGYGGSGFSTSFFVSTGSSRWAYDPYAGAYYDYSRRCYYDPYLSGYYPIGYRPRYVYGSPHPYGWSSGSDYCPAPSGVRSYNLTNYRDRSERYRSLGQSWSSDVRVNTEGRDQRSEYRTQDQRGSYDSDRNERPSYGERNVNSGSIFGGRSVGGDRRDNTQPNFRNRNSNERSSERRDENSRRSTPPMVIPRDSRDHSHSRRDNPAGIGSEAPQPSPQPAPEPERREDPSGGGRDRNDSERGQDKKIQGLGEG